LRALFLKLKLFRATYNRYNQYDPGSFQLHVQH